MSRNFELLKQIGREPAIPAADDRAELDDVEPFNLKRNVGAGAYQELNKLVQRLFLSEDSNSRCVLFTGAAPGVGCTWVAVQTAQVLCSQTTARVCLVEADGTRASLRERFGLARDSDSTLRLAADDRFGDSPRKLEGNLWMSPITKGPPSRQRVETQLLELRREFDYVLLDAHPIVGNSLSLTLGTLVDGAVLVLRASHTRRPAVRLAVEELESSGIKLLGTVLNQREYPIPEPIYKRL